MTINAETYTFNGLDQLYETASQLPEVSRPDVYAHHDDMDEWEQIPYRDSLWTDDGRVPVNVSLANGPIETGDPITVSPEEGVGMEAETSGMVVGTALEPYNRSSEDSKIFVFVNPRMYVPAGTVQELREENRKQSSRIQELEQENEKMQDVLCQEHPNASFCR